MNVTELNAKRAERGWPLFAEHGTSTAPDEDGFVREVAFEPGHAWTTKGQPPAKDYGRADLVVAFFLHGEKASIQFKFSTGITPERVVEHSDFMGGYDHEEWMHHAPMGFDLGYHADEPQFEGQEPLDCNYRPSGKCFYDGSSLASEDMLRVFLIEGEDAMWAAMRRYYSERFEPREGDIAVPDGSEGDE